MSRLACAVVLLIHSLISQIACGQEVQPKEEAGPGEPAALLVLDAGGHTSRVTDVVFARDGLTYFTSSNDRTVRQWDAATGDPLRVFRPPVYGNLGVMNCVDVSPDGRWLVTGGDALPLDDSDLRPVFLFSIDTGAIIRTFGGHANTVDSARFSLDGRRLLTTGHDQTARIWDVESGQLLQTLTGHTARVYEGTWSPDGERCATASLDGTAIVWSTRDGRRLATFRDHQKEILSIDWSPNGKWIASGGLDEVIRVWTPDGRPYKTFSASVQGGVGAIRFAPDSNRLLATHEDRLDQSTPIAAIIDLQAGTRKTRFTASRDTVLAAALSPDAELAVSIDGRDGTASVWRTRDGSLVSQGRSRGQPLRAAAWSADSRQIACGSTVKQNSFDGVEPLERAFNLTQLEWLPTVTEATAGAWQRGQLQRGGLELSRAREGKSAVSVSRLGKPLSTLESSSEYRRKYNYVRSAALLPGNLAAVGSMFEFRVFQVETGAPIAELNGHLGEVRAVSPSPDGRYLLSASYDMTLRIWDLETISRSTTLGAGGIGASLLATPLGGMVDRLLDGSPAQQDGRIQSGDVILEVGNSEESMQPLAGLDLTQMVGRIRGPAGTPVFLRVRRDGRADDLLCEIRRAGIPVGSETSPIMNLFFAGDEWIVWTREGYYAASPGGERLMGWQVNNGRDQAESFYPASQFRKQFYRPDVIKLLLPLGSATKALEQLGEQNRPTLAQALPPRVEILAPTTGAPPVDAPEVSIQVRAEQAGTHPVTGLQLLLNGRPFGGKSGQFRPGEPQKSLTHTFTVPLTPGAAHQFQVRGDNAVSYAISDPVTVVARAKSTAADAGPADPQAAASPAALYVLAIGVAEYQAEDLRLKYAAADARRLAETLQQHSQEVFHSVEVKLLVDADATQRGILTGLAWLRERMTQRDVGVLFYSGHGARDESGAFYFLPVDHDEAAPLFASGVPEAQIKQAVQSTPGRLLVLLDACHAGTVGGDTRKHVGSLTDDIVRDLAADDFGAIIMCSSMAREFSIEDGGLQAGCFTLALTEGLAGKADANQDAVVYLTELDAYVSGRVKELTRGRQHPVTAKPTTIRSFPITRIVQ